MEKKRIEDARKLELEELTLLISIQASYTDGNGEMLFGFVREELGSGVQREVTAQWIFPPRSQNLQMQVLSVWIEG